MEDQMINKHEAKDITQKEIRDNPVYNLKKALDKYGSPIHLLGALLYVNGFPYVAYAEGDSIIEFSAGHDHSSLELKVVFDMNTKELSGPFLEILDKTFFLITAIEHELNDAMLLPYNLRIGRIDEVCKQIGVDHSFFDLVLHNW